MEAMTLNELCIGTAQTPSKGFARDWKENRFCKTIGNQSGFQYVLSDQT